MTPNPLLPDPLIFALGWFLLVMVVGVVMRPRQSRRLTAPAPIGAADRGSVIESFGAWLLRVVGRGSGTVRARQVGAVALFVCPALLIDLRLGAVVLIISLGLPIAQSRRTVSQHHGQVLQELPEVIDLLTVAVAGGLTVPLAVAAVARRVPGIVAAEFERCGERAALGRRLADELDVIPDELGDATRPLIRALVSAERYGTPIVDALARVSADVRIERRRSAEIIARRLPIKLLFPLVACVLPAFVLLTVVPVLAGSLESIRS